MSSHSFIQGVSVVIPVYRSGDGLKKLYEELSVEMDKLGQPWELVLVEDCGGDNSWQVIEQLVEEKDHVFGVQLMRNFGQHNALLAGVGQARYDKIVTMDDDLQHPPSEIARLLAALEGEVDLVYGSPENTGHSFYRDFTSRVTKGLLKRITGFTALKELSAFRCFRTDLRKGFHSFQAPKVNLDVLLSWCTQGITSVQTAHRPRAQGRSNYNFYRLFQHTLNMLTGFSVLPLKVATISGLAMTGLGGLLLVFLLARYFMFGSTVQGFTFLASTLILFSGVQTFCIGLIGEYLGRVFYSTIGKPYYVIRNTIGKRET